jgi:hypothetical protein
MGRWISTHLPTFKNTTQGKWLLPAYFCAVSGILVSEINGLTREARCASPIFQRLDFHFLFHH